MPARGWIVPPPKEPTKGRAEFERERIEKLAWLSQRGLLRSERIRQAPPPLIEQLAPGGKLIAPVIEDHAQRLMLVAKTAQGLERQALCNVLYVSLRGEYGAGGKSAE